MDLITHAIVGASIGYTFGHPISGAIVALLPDVVLGFKRRLLPNEWYDLTHSPLVGGMAVFAAAVNSSQDIPLALGFVICYLSHIVLDAVTHGPDWAPKLLAPFSHRRYSFGIEWEFFNSSWWHGFAIATIGCIFCLNFKFVL